MEKQTVDQMADWKGTNMVVTKEQLKVAGMAAQKEKKSADPMEHQTELKKVAPMDGN